MSGSGKTMSGPHAGHAPVVAGRPLAEARYAMVLVHGRGGTAEGMLPIARAAGAHDAALIAPVAAEHSWYPQRFLAPVALNEPYLSSALVSLHGALTLAGDAGIPASRVILVGFSQGACLTLEYAARHATAAGVRFGGVVAMAGALIGDPSVPRQDSGSLEGTPVVLACGDADAHIPEALVRSSTTHFTGLGAAVDLRIYPGVGHDIVRDQLDALASMVTTLQSGA
jgi:phospholipase/carboxylesterase